LKTLNVNIELLQKCKSQQRNAQKELYQILLPYLSSIALRYLRDASYKQDALQESFVKIFKSLEKYDSNKGHFKSWASRITINTCLNLNARLIREPVEEISEHIIVTEKFEYYDLSQFTNDDLLMFLKNMPSSYREVFNLYVIDGYKHKEISQLLSISELLSRTKLSRAKAWLRKSIEKHYAIKSKSFPKNRI